VLSSSNHAEELTGKNRFESVAKLLRENKNIQKLKVQSTYRYNITHKDLLIMGDALAVNTSLRELKFSLRTFEIPEPIFEAFFIRLQKNVGLEDFEFFRDHQMKSNTKITGNAFERMLEFLRNHPTLKRFTYNKDSFSPENVERIEAVLTKREEHCEQEASSSPAALTH
jgi:hypothetical protein